MTLCLRTAGGSGVQCNVVTSHKLTAWLKLAVRFLLSLLCLAQRRLTPPQLFGSWLPTVHILVVSSRFMVLILPHDGGLLSAFLQAQRVPGPSPPPCLTAPAGLSEADWLGVTHTGANLISTTY